MTAHAPPPRRPQYKWAEIYNRLKCALCGTMLVLECASLCGGGDSCLSCRKYQACRNHQPLSSAYRIIVSRDVLRAKNLKTVTPEEAYAMLNVRCPKRTIADRRRAEPAAYRCLASLEIA